MWVAGGDEPHIDGYWTRAAQPLNLALLQYAEQLYLQRGSEFANFIQENDPAIGHFQAAFLLCNRAREGPALVPEEFALQQAFWNGRAIDGQKRLGRARAVAVNNARREFLSGSALPVDQHRRIGWRYTPKDLVQLLHAGALSNHVVLEIDFRVQPKVLLLQPLQPACVFQRHR